MEWKKSDIKILSEISHPCHRIYFVEDEWKSNVVVREKIYMKICDESI